MSEAKSKRKSQQKKIEKYHKETKAVLPGNFKQAVQLPENLHLSEWIAVHIVDFHKQIILLYGCIVDFCTVEHCPVMGAGIKFEYLWRDPDGNNKKPAKMSAMDYFDSVNGWVDKILDDEAVFPKAGNDFPADFLVLSKTIFKLFFRIFGHLYHAHFLELTKLGMEAHVNTCFCHFYYFIREFNLVDEQEMLPLKHLIRNLTG